MPLQPVQGGSARRLTASHAFILPEDLTYRYRVGETRRLEQDIVECFPRARDYLGAAACRPARRFDCFFTFLDK